MYIKDVVYKCISKIDRLDDYNYWIFLPYEIKEHILMQLKFSDIDNMLSQLKTNNI
ncbi:ankyrin repeat protein [Magpiepox virus 2]|nr:ankyrin repeat protein [Magpiepox virus 2]